MSDSTNPMAPYAGNILTQGMGPILCRDDILKALTYLPPPPKNIGSIPKHVRMHYLMSLRDLHIPSLEGARLSETIDLMIRPSYKYRDPKNAQNWGAIGGEHMNHKTVRAPASGATVVGHSGTGKTEAVLRALNHYPNQIIVHDTFPNIVGKHPQVLWQSVDVPATGRAVDLASSLMMNWDMTISRLDPNAPRRFDYTLSKTRRDGAQMLDEWRQVASNHYLGLLHLDEVQNFFKLQSLEKRRKRTHDSNGLELSIVEDQLLKWMLTMMNTSQISLLFSGTPDGIGALTKRLSTLERVTGNGYHVFPIFEDATSPMFYDAFFKILARYQYVQKPIEVTPTFAKLIIELSGGVPRILIALWIAAHRVAYERSVDDLRDTDFIQASKTYLSPIAPAIAALRSKDPGRMARYEDLVQRDDGFWGTFWSSIN